ncbi:MAG: hypothetical protein GXP04_09015 [Alphaproteobacteria bacterium]|nr:hypothetical protein [Alphaproteobacteria bacterium]
MDEIKDILLVGEEILWSGTPDQNNAKSVPPYWRRKLTHFLWVLGFSIAAIFLTKVGNQPNVSGFVQVILGIVIVVIAIGLIPAVLTFFDFKDDIAPHQAEFYAITDRRLIVLNTTKKTREYVLKNSVSYISTTENGSVYDLTVSHGWGEADFVTLYALPDTKDVEKIILDKFSIRSNKK